MNGDGTSWNGRPKRDQLGRLQFDEKVWRWYRLALAEVLKAQQHLRDSDVADADLIGQLVTWYADWTDVDEERRNGLSIPHYVRWVPAEEYSGRGYRNGGWAVDADLVQRDLPEALKTVAERMVDGMAAVDAPTCATLDDWLRADIAGTLRYKGATSGLDRSTCIVTNAERLELNYRAWGRRDMWPRECPDCRAMFTPEGRDKAEVVRCSPCRAKRRERKRRSADGRNQGRSLSEIRAEAGRRGAAARWGKASPTASSDRTSTPNGRRGGPRKGR